MPVIRPATAVRAARNLKRSTTSSATPTTSAAAIRPFSSTPRRAGSDSHEPAYDPPTGWLFGVKPGEKYQKEGWEGPMFYGFCGSLIIFAIAYAFKPDTSIQTWALEEARRRLEAEGILEDPDNKKP